MLRKGCGSRHWTARKEDNQSWIRSRRRTSRCKRKIHGPGAALTRTGTLRSPWRCERKPKVSKAWHDAKGSRKSPWRCERRRGMAVRLAAGMHKLDDKAIALSYHFCTLSMVVRSMQLCLKQCMRVCVDCQQLKGSYLCAS